MTLVYAKIMGIFVCGAEPGVRGWGVGAGRVGFFFIKSLQKSIVHICSSLICLGDVHMYVMMSHMPVLVKN